MNTFSPLCAAWHRQVKEFFHGLHGHQSKTLALFVLGAIRAGSSVLSKVAEALLEESEAKAPSIERRLQRFLSNGRIETEETWKPLLDTVMPSFQKGPMRLVIDLTSYEDHAKAHLSGHDPAFACVTARLEGDARTRKVGSGIMGCDRRIIQAFRATSEKYELHVTRR